MIFSTCAALPWALYKGSSVGHLTFFLQLQLQHNHRGTLSGWGNRSNLPPLPCFSPQRPLSSWLCDDAGVSEANAKAVMAHFSTAHALWKAYRSAIQEAMAQGGDGTAAARCLLQQQAGLHPGLSQKVYDTLFCNGAGL